MNGYRKAIIVLIFLFNFAVLCADAYYLREQFIGLPDNPEMAFINTPTASVLKAIRDAGIFGEYPAIIPAEVLSRYLPANSPVVGTSVRFIPAGVVPPESFEKVAELLQALSRAGNGRSAIIEVKNWKQMISESAASPVMKQETMIRQPGNSRERLVSGGDYVSVVATGKNVVVRIQGRAQRSGSYSDTIPVIIVSTRKTLQCRITGPGEVSLEF